MGCSGCSTKSNGTPAGCGNKGHCTSGSCNKMNTYDWISTLDIHDPTSSNIVEVSFKKGARKDFYINKPYLGAITGDLVVVEAASGYDVGRISLSGELVKMQMKKKGIDEGRVNFKIIRIANQRDQEKLEEARKLENKSMVKARVIARTMGLEMKVGDVEYQGDKKKATIYYTAEGRVDFRELVRNYAREFKVKIEMRQIGSRQESARIGGIGSCGRELCCSTWLSDFKPVSTAAARYQNIALNQTKLSGQCGRLKCCLNYELDSYMDALSSFPKRAETINLQKGSASLLKTDIFKGIMYYSYDDPKQRGPLVVLSKDDVKEILALNKKGEIPSALPDYNTQHFSDNEEEVEMDFADVTGEIELPNEKKRRRGRRNRNRNRKNKGQSKTGSAKSESDKLKQDSSAPQNRKPSSNRRKNKKKPKRKNKNSGRQNDKPKN